MIVVRIKLKLIIIYIYIINSIWPLCPMTLSFFFLSHIAYSCSGCEEIIDPNSLLLEAMGKMWHFDCFRLGEPKILVCMASMGPRIGNGCFKFLYEVLILDQEIHINIPLVKICLFCSAYQT